MALHYTGGGGQNITDDFTNITATATGGKRDSINIDGNDYTPWKLTHSGHGHGITQNNHSHGITQNNHTHTINSDGISESRPDNFTVKIWKRIS